MKRHQKNVEQIKIVASSLGALLNKVVFTGGAIVGLLITDPGTPDVRPTDDVDLIVEIASYFEYSKLQEQLRGLGFKNDMNGPTCRFIIHGIKVDVMPTKEKILGFQNKWYSTAIQHAKLVKIDENITIQMITAPIFICTKLDAFFDRGHGDYLLSHDLEDIITLIDGREELMNESIEAPSDVRSYLRDNFKMLLEDRNFRDSIAGHLPPDASNRIDIIVDRISELANLP